MIKKAMKTTIKTKLTSSFKHLSLKISQTLTAPLSNSHNTISNFIPFLSRSYILLFISSPFSQTTQEEVREERGRSLEKRRVDVFWIIIRFDFFKRGRIFTISESLIILSKLRRINV